MPEHNFVRPREPGVYDWPMVDLINGFEEGIIIPYENNRGKKAPNKSFIEKTAKNFYAPAWGQAAFSIEENGKYKIADAHQRMNALLLRKEKSFITPEDKNTNLSVELVAAKDHLKTYVLRNTCSGHTSSQKFNNPDLALGHIRNEILNRVAKIASSFELKDIIKPSMSNNLIYVAYAYGNRDKVPDWNYSNVFNARRFLNKKGYADKVKGSIKFSENMEKVYDDVASAVGFYYEYRRALDSYMEEHSTDLRIKCMYKASWFGVILVDFLGQKYFTNSATVLAKRTIRNLTDLVGKIPSITGGNASLITSTVDEIVRILNRR